MKNVHVNTVGNNCKLSYDDITEIIHLLKDTDVSMNQIHRQFNVDLCLIMLINNGKSKKYRRDGLKYPLRSYRNKKPYNCSL